MKALTLSEQLARQQVHDLIQTMVTEVNKLTVYPFEEGKDTHRETYQYRSTRNPVRFAIGMTYIGLFSDYEMEMTWNDDTKRLVVQYPGIAMSLSVCSDGMYPKLYDAVQTLVHYFNLHPETS